jgi:hypothetical protein
MSDNTTKQKAATMLTRSSPEIETLIRRLETAWRYEYRDPDAVGGFIRPISPAEHKLILDTLRTFAHAQCSREAAIEECAKFVEQHQESIRESSNGSERYLSARKVGNQMGLAYVDGIRSLADTSTLQRGEK